MELHTFFNNFEVMAEAPNGIEELRNLILELAVKGELSERLPTDTPVENIQNQLVKAKKNWNLASKDTPFDIPNSWSWVVLGQLGSTQTGSTPKKSHPEYYGSFCPFVKPADILDGRVTYRTEGLSKEGLESTGRVIDKGAIVMVCIGTIGKVGVVDRLCSFNQQINAISPIQGIDSQWLCYTLASKYFQQIAWSRSSSTTISILNKGKWEAIPIPIVPLEEQKRIVAKVDQLMALCDDLEEKKEKRNKYRVRANEASLDKLLNAKEPEEFEEHWQRVVENFEQLLSEPRAVARATSSFLELGIMGKLVAQCQTDESASEVLQRITAEKKKLVEQGRIRKFKTVSSLSGEEKRFSLPRGWEWCRLQQLVYLLGDGLHGTPRYSEDGDFFFVNGNNLKDGRIEIKPETKKVSQEEFEKYKKDLGQTTVLVSINGTLGRVGFYNGEPIVLGKSACYFNLAPTLSKEYFKLIIEAPSFLEYANQKATGSTIKNLGLRAMNEMPVALPPIEEQERIVTRVNELRSLCSALEKRFLNAETCQQYYARSITESHVC